MVTMKPLAICLLLVTSLALAESHEDLIDRAFESVEDDLSARWSYTRTDQDGDGVFVGHYDPRLPESDRWSLISVDGLEPSADEIEDYREQRAEEQENDSDDDENELASIVNRESVVLLDETDSFWLFGFQPTADSEGEQEFMKSVEGTLKIIKEGHYVAVITLQNRDTIKPGKGVKIKEFFTRLEFAPIQEGGPALPRSVQATVKGKAFLVVKFDETETVTYSDFEQAYD
jgi:hypothetical protein